MAHTIYRQIIFWYFLCDHISFCYCLFFGGLTTIYDGLLFIIGLGRLYLALSPVEEDGVATDEGKGKDLVMDGGGPQEEEFVGTRWAGKVDCDDLNISSESGK